MGGGRNCINDRPGSMLELDLLLMELVLRGAVAAGAREHLEEQ